MKYQKEQIYVPGQESGSAKFDEYILDPVSVAPERRRPAVVVCPGGGYAYCSDREAEPVVMQFLAMGCHCFCLYYSVAPGNVFPTALREAAKAVSIVRAHSDEWLVDPDRIYVCGFSAGGHLACSLGTFWNRAFVWEPLGLTEDQVKPSGLILGYPVITGGEFAHKGSFRNLLGEDTGMTVKEYFQKHVDCAGAQAAVCGGGISTYTPEEAGLTMEEFTSLERQVSSGTPDTFLWHTFEDGAVPVENSLLLASAMRQSGVNVELHIFPKGVHGLSLASKETSVPGSAQLVPAVQAWIPLVRAWIEGAR